MTNDGRATISGSKALRGMALAACVWTLSCRGPNSADTHATRAVESEPASNVTRQDFAGSQACAGCHPAIYDRWQNSPMHRMTRRMSRGEARAPFDGSQFRFKDDIATMVTRTGQHYMHLQSAKYGSSWFRITKVIGGRYREDYAGVQVPAPEATAPGAGEERILPVSYLLFDNTWRYKGYSVMSPERDGLKRGLAWRKSCIFCHNTAPWFSLYYDELYGVGAPTYQGAASLKLPSERRLSYTIADTHGFEHAVRQEIELLAQRPAEGDSVEALLEEAALQTKAHFSEQHLVEIGIGCEACHGGSRAHSQAPGNVLPSYTPESSFLRTTTTAGTTVPAALAQSHSCAKCHTVLFSRYPFTWEGGERGFSPGGSSMNSGEARDFLLGGCTAELGCASCHDPHAEDAAHKLEELQTVAGNRVCTSCHTSLSSPAQLERHTHHSQQSTGSACVACHMPKKNVGLNYELTSYHRIGSPTDTERVEGDRPIECALCHTEMSVLDLIESMETLWNKRYDRTRLQQLYGRDLRQNAVRATLEHGKPHEQVVAIALLGGAGRQDTTELLLAQLAHEFPLLRFFARHALEQVTGMPLELDMHAPGHVLRDTARRALAQRAGDVPPPAQGNANDALD
jgi:predicted CXXCH cytochrome family protein